MIARRFTGRCTAILASCCLLVFCIGCTQPTAGGGVRTEGDREAAPRERVEPYEEEPNQEQPPERDAPAIYDLEEEVQPEDTPVDPDEIEDEIEPLPPDTVSIEEVTVDEATGRRHDLGYRVQIFASGELSKAKAMRDAATARTGYAAYIEYEGGLYKVRVGDFTSRGAAAGARAELVELYPDCWIVQTTIQR